MKEDGILPKKSDLKPIVLSIVGCLIFTGISSVFSPGLSDLIKNHFQLEYNPFFIGLFLLTLLLLLSIIAYFRWYSSQISILKIIHKILVLATSIFSILCILSIFYVMLFQIDNKESSTNQNVFGLILFSLCVIIPTIFSSFLLSASSNCPMIYEVNALREKVNCAVTATCIPFYWKDEDIRTYLYLNPKYDSKEWMFPGGHAFANKAYWHPEDVAKYKAKNEVGVDIEIINLDNKNEQPTENEICIKTITPHFVYKIKQGAHVECYKQGHRFHYDCIYIGDVLNISEGQYENRNILRIKIPVSTSSFEQIKSIVSNAITDKASDTETIGRNVRYVSKMLFNAFVNYKEYKEIE